MSNWLQVPRVNAQDILAEVVDIKTIGDRPATEYVSHAVGHGSMLSVYMKGSIATGSYPTIPLPAIGGNRNMTPETVGSSLKLLPRANDDTWRAVLLPANIVHLAHFAASPRLGAILSNTQHSSILTGLV